MNALIPVPVLLPLLGAGLALVLVRRPRAQLLVSVSVLSMVVALAAFLVWYVDQHGTMAVWVGGWDPPLGIALVVLVFVAFMMALISLLDFGFGQLAMLVFGDGAIAS